MYVIYDWYFWSYSQNFPHTYVLYLKNSGTNIKYWYDVIQYYPTVIIFQNATVQLFMFASVLNCIPTLLLIAICRINHFFQF